MYVSIDQAVDKLEAQILRYKSKIQDYHRKKTPITEMPVEIIRRPGAEESEFDLEEGELDGQPLEAFRPHQIIKQKSLPLKLLTYDEAIMKMELSRDMFLVFKNEADQKLKIIYRRKDGNYGVIAPYE